MQFYDYFPEVVGENYTFSQTQEEATVSFKVPDQTTKQNVNVTITNTSIIAGVKNKPPTVVGVLFDGVDNSTWQFESKKTDKYITIHIEKAGVGLWPILIKGPKGTEIDTQSLFQLASAYELGNHPKFPQNLPQALNYFKDAADKGSISAQTKLASIYSLGEKTGYPIKQDDELTVKYAKLAADGGSPEGMALLGQIYIKGMGPIPKDIEEARKWLNKAHEMGDIMAPFIIGHLYIDEEKQPNYTEAIKWIKIAVDKGNVLASYALAELYKDGKTGEVVPEKNSEKYYLNMLESEKYYLRAHEIDPNFAIPDEIKEFQKNKTTMLTDIKELKKQKRNAKKKQQQLTGILGVSAAALLVAGGIYLYNRIRGEGKQEQK